MAKVYRGTPGSKEYVEVTTLERNDCFGEQALVPTSMLQARKPKRKLTMTASGKEPLVTLKLSADVGSTR